MKGAEGSIENDAAWRNIDIRHRRASRAWRRQTAQQTAYRQQYLPGKHRAGHGVAASAPPGVGMSHRVAHMVAAAEQNKHRQRAHNGSGAFAAGQRAITRIFGKHRGIAPRSRHLGAFAHRSSASLTLPAYLCLLCALLRFCVFSPLAQHRRNNHASCSGESISGRKAIGERRGGRYDGGGTAWRGAWRQRALAAAAMDIAHRLPRARRRRLSAARFYTRTYRAAGRRSCANALSAFCLIAPRTRRHITAAPRAPHRFATAYFSETRAHAAAARTPSHSIAEPYHRVAAARNASCALIMPRSPTALRSKQRYHCLAQSFASS